MGWQNGLLGALAIVAASAAFGQTIYKTIGPDGKPVYSDKPPTNPATKYSVIGAPPGQTPPAVSGKPDSNIENAVIEVMATDDLVQRTEALCVKARPDAAEKYNKSATAWKKRNARLLTVQRRVLLEAFSPAERSAIEAKVSARTREALAAASKHGPYTQSPWCEESLATINSGSMDVASKPDISKPLLNYRPKPP
jgi:hypothetical protein